MHYYVVGTIGLMFVAFLIIIFNTKKYGYDKRKIRTTKYHRKKRK